MTKSLVITWHHLAADYQLTNFLNFMNMGNFTFRVKPKILPVVLSLMLLFCIRANAQKSPISGRVSDSQTNQPVVGATVKVKGSTAGTATDAKGAFTLSALPGAVLEITSIGYQTISVPADFAGPMLIKILPDNSRLSEVIVVGYSTVQKRATLTGAISTLDSSAFKNRVSTNPLSAIQGTVPGVVVSRTSGKPGQENWNFQVRGASSTNSTPPLVVVDGVPYTDPSILSSFNNDDIATMSFLKDGSAAIYGARAANGVVLITTKSGKSGAPVVNYNGLYALKPVGLMRKYTNLRQWYEMTNEAYTNNNAINPFKSFEQYFQNPAGQVISPGAFNTNDEAFFDYDLSKATFGTSSTNQQNVSISGRGNKAGYYLSLGYLNDGSNLKFGTNFNKKYNVRINMDYNLLRGLKVTNQLYFERQNRIEPSALSTLLNGPSVTQPGAPLYRADGQPLYNWGNFLSPAGLAELGGNRDQVDNRINEQFGLNYDINNNFRLNGSAAVRYTLTDIQQHINNIPFTNYAGTVVTSQYGTGNDFNSFRRDFQQSTYQSYFANSEYHQTFNSVHNVYAMAGVSQEKYHYDAFFNKVNNVLPGLNSIAQGMPLPNANDTRGGDYYDWAINSYFGRVTYNYKSKYLFEAIGRYDGSSRFTDENNHRWKFFPSVLAGWVITNESFMANLKWLNNLKLRGSYAVVGNQAGIGNYDYIATVNNNAGSYPFGASNPTSVTTTAPGGIVAPNRTWEQVETKNIGLDFSLLNNRLSGTFEIYEKYNRNMLIAVVYPVTLGGSAPFTNNGNLRTRGFDLTLSWNDRIGQVNYGITGILSDNKNNLINIGGANVRNPGVNGGVQGFPINSYFGYQYAGIIQNAAQLADYKATFSGGGLPANIGVGDAMFTDLNGDHKFDATDIKYLGNNNIRLSFSTQLNLSWKNIDFSSLFQGVGRRDTYRNGSLYRPYVGSGANQSAYFYHKTWSPDRTDAPFPKLTTDATVQNYDYAASSLTIKNNKYIRLKNFVIGYTLPKNLTQKAGLSKVRIYFSGENLWEAAAIKDGWDPEAPDSVDQFPFYRTYALGLNVTF
ncbi:SusC/RagA family TonB-linked outer membrane protein [Mucilaginibacter sp. SJ]|uniref:SusC/RagA family TonB-linked outer membrane protein n=1 Tax=Mucilaginibacter sp. SJ TaxID=3029053 RepID=UPI0023A94EAE|nr:TonB-dependent receptor [Mucilaginibacter sp. SJ]WEA00604.1 TonB-dependent receptor [Mucilaginibacter sp. SJ]